MTTTNPNQTHEEIVQGLVDHAKQLWGAQRANELRSSLESTATQLLQLADNLPDRDVEPGFYPGRDKS